MTCHNYAGLEINFEQSDYSIEEGGALSSNICLQFRNNQNSFRFCPVNISTAENMNLSVFINSGAIDIISRATAGEWLNRVTDIQFWCRFT